MAGFTSLHKAAQDGCLLSVKALLKSGADIDAKTEDGRTAVILAADGMEHYSSIQSNSHLLLSAERNYNAIVKVLIKAGANLNCSDSDHRTVLHLAAQNGWYRIVRSIVKRDVNIDVETHDGWTPLLVAARYRYKAIVEILINAGANINSTTRRQNQSVLHYASENGWTEIVQCLLEKGADVNAENNNGISPLSSLITRSSDVKLVRLFIDYGAYFKTKDYERMLKSSLMMEGILRDVELCTQSVINKYYKKDLFDMYNLYSKVGKNLPRIEKLRMGNQATLEVKKYIKKQIQIKGHCNVLEVRPILLQMLSVNVLF